jgi:hypothetical protein
VIKKSSEGARGKKDMPPEFLKLLSEADLLVIISQ